MPVDLGRNGYAALKGPNDGYLEFVTELPTLLGRAKKGAEPKSGFIVLCNDKTCSRKAAEIDWDKERRTFIITVLGRNGICVRGAHYEKDQKIPLGRGDAVRIGPRKFYFLQAVDTTSSSSHVKCRVEDSSASKFVPITGEKTATKEDLLNVGNVGYTSTGKPRMSYLNILRMAFNEDFQRGFTPLKTLARWIMKKFPYFETQGELCVRKSIGKVLNGRNDVFLKQKIIGENGKRKSVRFALISNVSPEEMQSKTIAKIPSSSSSSPELGDSTSAKRSLEVSGDTENASTEKKRRVSLVQVTPAP